MMNRPIGLVTGGEAGDGIEAEYEQEGREVFIETPHKRPYDHAYVFKIERFHRPPLNK
jgi:hypothetical protein